MPPLIIPTIPNPNSLFKFSTCAEDTLFPKILCQAFFGNNFKPCLLLASIPAAPIDRERRVDYHEDVLKAIIEGYGYTASAIGESVAVA